MSEIQTESKASKECDDNLLLNYKQPAGIIFTDWKSAGITGMENKKTISEYPLKSANNLKNEDIVFNNNNNVRNNFENHGYSFLDNTFVVNELALTDKERCRYSNANFQ